MRFSPDSVDVLALDAAYTDAIRRGTAEDLDVVGYGEISLVFGWDDLVVKSLPAFRGTDELRAYEALLDEYLATLEERGVTPVPTAVRSVQHGPIVRAYVLQPTLPAEALGPRLLATDRTKGTELLERIVDAVTATVDAHVGLDAQVSNWALVENRLWFLDVTTPMLRDDRGVDRLDTRALVTSLPWILRAPVRRFVAPSILSPYHDRRQVVLDTAGNLHKEKLGGWIDRLLALANPHLERPLTPEEVSRFYRGNARMWEALQRARQADRWWQQRVRRRPYRFLIPPRIDR